MTISRSAAAPSRLRRRSTPRTAALVRNAIFTARLWSRVFSASLIAQLPFLIRYRAAEVSPALTLHPSHEYLMSANESTEARYGWGAPGAAYNTVTFRGAGEWGSRPFSTKTHNPEILKCPVVVHGS